MANRLTALHSSNHRLYWDAVEELDYHSGDPFVDSDERHFIERTYNVILLPFIELVRRTIPFNKGVLTAIRPLSAPTPEFEVSQFSPFHIAARFADPAQSGDLSSPEIVSLVNSMDGFALNLLFVAHRQARFYRYGLVLEADVKLTEAHVKTAYTQAVKKNRLDRLVIEREPALQPLEDEEQTGLIFEAYRTLTAERYVKFYFRNIYHPA